MKLSVVTITCREHPRFAEMCKTLVAAFQRRTSKDTTLEWIIVDERFHPTPAGAPPEEWPWHQERWKALDNMDPGAPGFAAGVGFGIRLVRPLPSRYRGGDKTPAHNSARNAGLAAATGDYVVFLNDCTVVTRGWVATAELVGGAQHGWRVKSHVVNDLALPADGVLKYRDHYDLLRPVQANAVPGACWGAPRDKLVEIGGFDLAYDGEDKCHDLDAVIRLERCGVAFVTTEQAFCVRLRRTKTQAEISTRKEAFHGARNQKLLNELLRERDRALPRIAAQAFGGPDPKAMVEDPSLAVPAAAPLTAQERRAARAQRAQRARKTTLPFPGKPRPPRPGHDAAAVKPKPGEHAVTARIRPLDTLGLSDDDDELDALEDELAESPDFASTPYYPPAGLVTPSGPGDPAFHAEQNHAEQNGASDQSSTIPIDPDDLDDLVESTR